MKGTIKLYVNPEQFNLFIQVLSALEILNIENEYSFDHETVEQNFTEKTNSSWM